MKAFRALTTLLLASVLLALLLHLPLLGSDSPTYRGWVYAQMLLLGAAAWLLWHLRKLRLSALFGLVLVSAPLVYINATFINYGNGALVWEAPTTFLLVYCGIAAIAFRRFRVAGSTIQAEAASRLGLIQALGA
jgi:hypothetical protein